MELVLFTRLVGGGWWSIKPEDKNKKPEEQLEPMAAIVKHVKTFLIDRPNVIVKVRKSKAREYWSQRYYPVLPIEDHFRIEMKDSGWESYFIKWCTT